MNTTSTLKTEGISILSKAGEVSQERLCSQERVASYNPLDDINDTSYCPWYFVPQDIALNTTRHEEDVLHPKQVPKRHHNCTLYT